MRVERHLEDGRDPACRGPAGAGLPALPIGPAGFVEVDVSVHDAGKHDEAARVEDLSGLVDLAAYRTDDAIAHRDVGDALTGWKDDGAATNDERAHRTSSIVISCAPSQSVSRPISGSSSCPSITVAKWFPASCPTLLANSVE